MAKVIIALAFCLQTLLPIGKVDAQDYFPSRQSELDCSTPDGIGGVCISIRECPALLKVLTARPLPPNAVDFLRRSQCGFAARNQPKVCCPSVLTTVGPVEPSGNNDNRNVRNNPLLSEDCGRDLTNRIVGGEITELDEFPWMVLLEYRKPTGMTTACGGVLISRRYVMTAAHCLKGKDLPRTWTLTGVRLGEYDTSTTSDCVKDSETTQVCSDDTVSVGIEEQITHEQYRPKAKDQKYDIALLRLSRDVTFTNYIRPICLPTNSSLPRVSWVAGWGKTETKSESNVKLKLQLPFADAAACAQKYRNAGVTLGEGQICAGGQRGKDSCRGDSGGPLMSVETTPEGFKRWSAIGVVSFGPSPCGMQGWPGVYTKIYDYVPWVLSKMRQ